MLSKSLCDVGAGRLSFCNKRYDIRCPCCRQELQCPPELQPFLGSRSGASWDEGSSDAPTDAYQDKAPGAHPSHSHSWAVQTAGCSGKPCRPFCKAVHGYVRGMSRGRSSHAVHAGACLRSRTFWLLFFTNAVSSGAGLTLLNNTAQMVRAQFPPFR